MTTTQDHEWLDSYFARYREAAFEKKHYASLCQFRDLVIDVRERARTLYFAGNGASASIASHARVDFTKQCGCRSMDFNEPNLITAFSNDYGFENFMAKAVEHFAQPGDALVLVSVSGRSANCVRAAETAKSRNMTVVTFTGMNKHNPLRQFADIDFWIESNAYNIVECTHMVWMCTVVDMVVGRAEYSVT